ncbi:hypothetical protein GWI33_011849 [Rhynchophorus ferrugineus]|uniref:Uncharacterized protein n=1 Tax=Rhynchophorus ferrugineus TaxID=354439 RepID=A0A834MCV9_RHYFE|nr:hypothetical protein GWI33_011849 [Rhynchophorus ferrugineus]
MPNNNEISITEPPPPPIPHLTTFPLNQFLSELCVENMRRLQTTNNAYVTRRHPLLLYTPPAVFRPHRPSTLNDAPSYSSLPGRIFVISFFLFCLCADENRCIIYGRAGGWGGFVEWARAGDRGSTGADCGLVGAKSAVSIGCY